MIISLKVTHFLIVPALILVPTFLFWLIVGPLLGTNVVSISQLQDLGLLFPNSITAPANIWIRWSFSDVQWVNNFFQQFFIFLTSM